MQHVYVSPSSPRCPERMGKGQVGIWVTSPLNSSDRLDKGGMMYVMSFSNLRSLNLNVDSRFHCKHTFPREGVLGLLIFLYT